MTGQILTTKGKTYPGGVAVCDDGSINIAVSMESDNCGIIFYNGTREI